MLKKQKNQVFIFGIVAILIISLATPIPAAALDIEVIYMTSCKDHLDGTAPSNPWCFEIWIDLVDPGTLHHIDVTPPVGGTPFTIHEVYDYWEYESPTDYSTLAALQAVYPTGTYTLDFCDSMDTVLRSVTLDYIGLSEPGAAVNFTYPSTNGQMGISTNPTFTWDPVSDGDALLMWLWDRSTHDDVYENVPVSISETSWVIPGSLAPGHTYCLEVSVINAKDLGIGPALPIMTVGGDTFEYCLMIEYLNEINFTTIPATGTLSGWVFIPPDIPDIGYSLDEGDLLYFYSSVPVWSYNFTTDEWNTVGPKDLIYANWPFIYELESGHLWFALPPVDGLWVYHFSTSQWTVLPRIIPW